jgi:hypothetical protein
MTRSQGTAAVESGAGTRVAVGVALGNPNTLYTHLGDWVGWVALAGFAFFMFFPDLLKRRQAKQQAAQES